MQDKIIIVGLSELNKLEIARELIRRNDNLSIAPHFSSDQSIKEHGELNDDYIYYLDNATISLAFKNNSLLYVMTDGYVSTGVTTDDYYNNDIICIDIIDFNNIPDRYFTKKNENLIIWIDSRVHKHINSSEMLEIRYLQERLDTLPYIYFLDDTVDNVCTCILEYIEASEDRRREIIEDNM